MRDGEFVDLAFLSHARPHELVYVADARAAQTARSLARDACVITTRELAPSMPDGPALALSEAPESAFYSVHAYLVRETEFYWQDVPTEIHATARVHPRAYVAERNVQVGPRVVIEANATILEHTVLYEDVIVRAGTIIASEGFEFKAPAGRQHRPGRAPMPPEMRTIPHAGSVVLARHVEVQANAAIDRSLFRRPTFVGEHTKIDNLVHIAHSAEIGRRCLIVAGAIVAGSASIGDDVWIGPGAIVSSGVRVGDRSSVVLGTTVIRDVPSETRVAGDLRVFKI